jgi:hypothetical protein
MDQTHRAARQTLQRVTDRVRLLAAKDREALTALDGFLGTLIQAQGHAYWRGLLLAMLETGANTPEPRTADVSAWESKRASADDAEAC